MTTKTKTKEVPYVINKQLAVKLLKVVDQGLCSGLGGGTDDDGNEVGKPGDMCVEAAVCFALGLPHGDRPPCVAKWLIDLKIHFNDEGQWIDNKARGKTLRRLAIVQLGTRGIKGFTEDAFNKKFKERMLTKVFPAIHKTALAKKPFDMVTAILEYADLVTLVNNKNFKPHRLISEISELKYNGYDNLDDDDVQEWLAEEIVLTLKAMKAPGAKYLYLTE